MSYLLTILLAALAAPGTAGEDAIPYPANLDAAAIRVERLDSILEYALVIGNGDINALVYTEGGDIVMQLTKNDVWDARLLTEGDAPLPTIANLKRRIAEGPLPSALGNQYILPDGAPLPKSDSYGAPYPCPVTCGQARFTVNGETNEPAPRWRRIRAEGDLNAWTKESIGGSMTIEGTPGASNGYALDALALPTGPFNTLRLTLSGTPNARFFVDAVDPEGGLILSSGWRETPETPEDLTFSLPPDKIVDTLILYSWTEDGKLARNSFTKVVFEGSGGQRDVSLGMPPEITMTGELDIRQARATIVDPANQIPGMHVRALWDANAFLIETNAPASLRPGGQNFLPMADAREDCVIQDIPGDLDWPGMRYAVALARGEGRCAVAIVTSLESTDPAEAAKALARKVLDEADALTTSHEQAWARFWSASGLSTDDPLLNSLWLQSQYFLRCVSKPGVVCPGLYASLTTDTPAWHGDYHLNYNLQQTFWSAYSTNHPELAEPYDRLIRGYLPRAQWIARQVYGCEGAFYPHVLYAFEPSDPESCKSVNGRQYIHHTWGLTLGVAGFAVQPLWVHYLHAPDPAYLETTVYPPIREVAVFYTDFLRKCERTPEGKARFGPSVSPEHWGWTENLRLNYDGVFDLAYARYTLEAARKAAAILGIDAVPAARWTEALTLLSEYPLSDGDPPVVVDMRGAPVIEYNISDPAVPVYPGDLITWRSSDAEKSLFTRTIEGMKWNGNNATFMLAVSRARLGMPGTVDWLRRECVARLRPNQTITLNVLGHPFNTFGHYTEQFAVAQAISELLVQSVGGVVRLFPAWPPERDAAFTNIRTEGGFLVSSAWKEGRVVSVEARATVDGEFALLTPWPDATFQVDAGAANQAVRDEQGVAKVTLKAGETASWRPLGE